MKSIEQKLDRILEVVVDLHADMIEVMSDVAHVKTTVNQHTTTLDGISKQLLDVTSDRAALVLRLERYDKFMKIVAEKLKLDLNILD